MEKGMQEVLDTLKKDFGSVLNAVPEIKKRQEEHDTEREGLMLRIKKQDDAIAELLERVARKERVVDDLAQPGIRIDARGKIQPRVSRDLSEYFVRVFKGTNVRELSEAVGADGGFLVPTERIPELVDLITNYGAYRRDALVVPMASNSQIWPSLAAGVNVYWIAENNAAVESFPTFANVQMDAKTLVGLSHVSAQLLEDATPDLGQLLVDLFARAIAQEEDHQGFAGTGAGADPFYGVLNVAGTNSVVKAATQTTFASITADDLLALQGAVASNLLTGAKYYMHRSIFDTIRKLKDTQNNYIWAPPTSEGPGTIWGYPFELVEVMPNLAATAVSTPFVIFGNMRNAYLGDRHSLEIARSDQYAFNKLQTFIRIHERVAIKVALPQAFAVLKTAAA